MESEATNVFLSCFRFELFMKAEWRPNYLDDEEIRANVSLDYEDSGLDTY